MSTNDNKAAGGIAMSFAAKTLLFEHRSPSHATPTVQSQQTMTVNTYRTSSAARTFASARKIHHLFSAK